MLQRLLLLTGLIALSLVSHSAEGQTLATWTGAGDGVNYGDPQNWDVGLVPINNSEEAFRVVLGSKVAVQFNLPGTGHEIFQLETGIDSTLTINSGRELAVVDEAVISGVIETSNSRFLAPSPASRSTGAGRFLVDDGGELELGIASIDNKGFNTSDIFRSSGSASEARFPQLRAIRTSDPSGRHSIIASNGGRLNLSAVDVIAWSNSNEQITVQADTEGNVDLRSLQTVESGPNSDSIEFRVSNGGSINLSSLQRVQAQSRFVSDGVPIPLPSLETIQGPAEFDFAPGMTVDLPALRRFEGEETSHSVLPIPTSGSFNASALELLQYVDVTMQADSEWIAPELLTIDSAAIDLGAATTFEAPKLTELTRSSLEFGGSSVVQMPSLKNIDGTQIRISGGRTLAVPVESYDDLGLFASHQDTFVAAGQGTLLDLSQLNSLNKFYGWDRTIAARDGAMLDLSGLDSVLGGDS